MKVLVMGVKKYDFAQEGTGEVFQGMNITAIDTSVNENEPDKKGVFPMKIKSPDINLFDRFTVFPAYYDIKFTMKPDGKGNPVVVLTSADLINEVQFVEVSANTKKTA